MKDDYAIKKHEEDMALQKSVLNDRYEVLRDDLIQTVSSLHENGSKLENAELILAIATISDKVIDALQDITKSLNKLNKKMDDIYGSSC